MAKKTKIFFVTDLHGSEVCYRKFLNAGKFYGVDILICGGDVTGKMIVPVIKKADGTWEAKYYGTTHVAKNEEELTKLKRLIRDGGFYPYETTEEEMKELSKKTIDVDEIFKDLVLDTLREWIKLAEERLGNTGIKTYMTGGNDDIQEITDILKSSNYIIDPEDEVVWIDDHHEMVSTGYSNITPWKCPRDIGDDELWKRIEPMLKKVENMKNCIFNFHVPPYDTPPLDSAPELDETLKPIMEGGSGLKMIPVGSKAVRRAIEEYQPLLGLHGHIHEGKGTYQLGRTLCINPGSEYGEGILRGVLITLKNGKIDGYTFTSG
ncbi:MAG: metallophosphoesterase family protein [Candidatus Odinarchaeia archaeon]